MIMLPKSARLRLETQLDVVPLLLREAAAEALMARTASGEWSPHENLAHLARHHAIFLERIHRIIAEEAPKLARYRAEDDSSWSEWSSLSTDKIITRLNTLRAEIVQFIKGLSDEESDRVGIHPLLGEMDLTHWLEFFLLHEAHHLYKVMIRLGETRRARRL
jgi:uncharacterized damage-inducible protein DinB